MATPDRVALHKQLNRLDLEELRTLCYYLDVAYDDLRGEGKSAKERELLLFLERHDQLDRLFTIIEQTGSEQPTLKNRYAAYLRYQYGHVPLGGIAPRLQGQALSIPLNELFVPLQAEPDAPLHTQYIISGTRGYQPQRAMDPRLVGLDEVIAHRCVVILGEPGSGKSTFLRWLIAKALESADIAKVNNGDLTPESLPIFVRLVNFASALERQPNLTLAQFIQNYHLPEYQSLFKGLLARGRGWLLLDGLDEVADPYLRRQVREAVQTFAAQFSNFQMVVTSRIVGYRNAQLHSGFRQFTLQPFSLDEIVLFIHNWHHAVQRLNTDPVDLADADQRAKLLLEKIKGKPRIIQLASTPLLLAIIALMDWKGKELPNRRVELYRVAIETLLV